MVTAAMKRTAVVLTSEERATLRSWLAAGKTERRMAFRVEVILALAEGLSNAEHPGREIHVILDNLNTHKPKHDRWLARHSNVHFHFTPTHASWLNQVEVVFDPRRQSPGRR
jgi:hypothetical protein